MAGASSLTEEDRENLVAYLDGELDEETSRALEAKLSRDPAARAELDELKRTWDVLDFLPRPQPSVHFTHRTLERIAPITAVAQPPARRTAGSLAWAAGVLVALGAGYFGAAWFRYRGDPERDLLRDLRLIENKRLYDAVDHLEFLRRLDHPDLFGVEFPES